MSNIFSSDWFYRSSDFTHSNSTNKLNWEGSLTSKFSSYIYGNNKANALVGSNTLLSEELSTIANALGVHASISIDSKSESSMTDGRSIIISNKFDTEVGDKYDVLDLIIGLLCHESAHCLYTDFNYILGEGKRNPIDSLTHWIHNLIEDELIETKLGDSFPGYINFIAQIKYYYFEKCCKDIIDSDCKNDLDEIMRLLLYSVRYPKYISSVDSNILNKYDDLFNKIKNILGGNGCLDAKYNEQITRLSLLSARQIVELLKDYIDDAQKNDGGEDDKSGGSSDENKSFEQQKNDVLNDDDSVISKTIKINAKCSSSSETNKTATYNKILNEKKIETSSTETQNTSRGFLPLESIGIDNPNVSDMYKYRKAVSLMTPYINECKKLFIMNDKQSHFETTRYHRNGSLDTRRLVDAMTRINTIYSRRTPVVNKNNAKFALVLTLDESGSMSWDKIFDKSTNIAIMIAEATKEFSDIELYIYGHGDNVITYKNKKVNKLYSIANRKIQCEQNEVLSYSYIIDDVRKQTSLPIVVINITDSAYLSNALKVRNLLANYRKNNCSFNCICLSGGFTTEAENKMNDEIYGEGNWVVLKHSDNEVITMINKLSDIIKKNYNKRK